MAHARVVGRFLAVVADSADADGEPDRIPLSGMVTLTASVPSILEAGPAPATHIPAPIEAKLDDEGYITYDGQRGVTLIAPGPGLSPADWTWEVKPRLSFNGRHVPYESWSISAPADVITDLTTTAPVPKAVGEYMVRGVGVQDARNENGELILTLTDGSELNGGTLPKGDKGDRGFPAPDSGMRRSPTSYLVGPNGAETVIPNEDIPSSGTIFMSIDGNGPMPIWFQVYRAGTYNGVKLVSPQAHSHWAVGETTEPTSGSWKIWVDGNERNALLKLKSDAAYSRRIRFFWYDLHQGDGSMGGSDQGVTIRDIYPTRNSLPTTGNMEGDAVLVSETGNLHVWNDGAWSDGARVQGPPGPEGPMGPGVTVTEMIPASALPSEWPEGITITQADKGGYPAQFATVETVRFGVNRSWQTCVERTTGRSWRRTPDASDAGWLPWIEWGAKGEDAPSDAVYLKQAEYDALATKDPLKTYYILGAL